MAARYISIAVAVGTLAAVLVWWRHQEPVPAPPLPQTATDPDPTAVAAAGAEYPARRPAPDAFRERVRSFLDTAQNLDAAQRRRRAETLREEILTRERQTALLPGESAYLQLALLRATISDEARLRERSQALLDEYQARSDAGWAEYRERPDIRHQAYRAAEAELVRRVSEGPDSMSQAELRRRLQELREQYYREGSLQ